MDEIKNIKETYDFKFLKKLPFTRSHIFQESKNNVWESSKSGFMGGTEVALALGAEI